MFKKNSSDLTRLETLASTTRIARKQTFVKEMCKILLTLCVAAHGLATTQAFGTLLTKDASSFDYVYNMDVDPTGQDLDSNGTNDWQWSSGSGWGNGGGTFANGIMTLDGSVLYHEFYGSEIFNATQSAAAGHTVEFRVKVNVASFDFRANIDGNMHGVKIHPDAIYTGRSTAIAYTEPAVLTADASDAFHTYRLAKHPGENKWSLWRDGVNIEDGVIGYPDSGSNFTTGSFNSDYPNFEADYYALTAGTWAPIPEPSTCSLLILAALALFPMVRSKRS